MTRAQHTVRDPKWEGDPVAYSTESVTGDGSVGRVFTSPARFDDGREGRRL